MCTVVRMAPIEMTPWNTMQYSMVLGLCMDMCTDMHRQVYKHACGPTHRHVYKYV